jgi:AbiTii
LLDDVELSRLGPEQLLLKASRLARLVDDSNARAWIRLELNGYPGTPDARRHAHWFGRIETVDAKNGYWQPLAGISGSILSMQNQIQQLTVPNVHFAPSSSNPHENVTGYLGNTVKEAVAPAKDVLSRLQVLSNATATLTSIRSKVLAAIHEFAARIYYERAFVGLADSIFDRHKAMVDGVVAATAKDVLEKLPAIYDRLAESDSEATSQALNSVRRMIKAFADTAYPQQQGTKEVDGQQYQLGSDKVLNRIRLYVTETCASKSRADRLSRTIRDIYERASAGAHSDVTADEARALFLHAYLTIGEIITAASALPSRGSELQSVP